MEDWIDIIIFAAVIIANIVGGILKIKKKKTKKFELPPIDAKHEQSDEYYQAQEDEEIFFEKEPAPQLQTYIPPAVPQVQYAAQQSIPFPATTDANAPCHECSAEVSDDFCKSQSPAESNDEDEENFDYGEFMQAHGREAFILAEIILPANSRQRG